MRRVTLREDDQVYFLHIPKTAGLSLAHLLHDYLPAEDRPHYVLRDLLNSPAALKRRLIVGHIFYTLHHLLPRPPVCITMLREPVGQVVSHFRHIKRYPEHPLHDRFHDKTLLDFLHDPGTARLIRNFQTLNLAIDADPRAVARSLTPAEREKVDISGLMMRTCDHLGEREMLDRVKARLQDFAFVGITDRFDDSVELLTYTFRWPPFSRSVQINRDPDPFLDIPRDARDLIAENTQLDQQVYQFALNLLETRRREMISDLLQTDYASRKRRWQARWPA